jgi:hypothetical protein
MPSLSRRFVALIAWGAFVATTFFIFFQQESQAAGVVGNGTAASCTESALANRLSGGGTVTFNCGNVPVTIRLTSPQNIAANTVLDGTGQQITLSGGGANQLFVVKVGKTFTVRNLTFRDARATSDWSVERLGGSVIQGEWTANINIYNSTFLNNVYTGQGNGSFDEGGAVYIHTGTLEIDNSVFIGNSAQKAAGGAVHVLLSNARITNSTFKNNSSTAPGQGGAFYNDGTLGDNGYIILHNNLFDANTGEGQGGAIFQFLYTFGGSANQPGSYSWHDRNTYINNVVNGVSGNDEGYGGALRTGNGKYRVTNSFFHNNHAKGQGGAMWLGELSTSQIEIANVTVTGNRAESTVGTGGLGGAIMMAGDRNVSIDSSTITNNYAGFQGGAFWGGGANTILRNSIVSGNFANNGGNPWNIKHHCGTPLADGGNNIQFPTYNNPSDTKCAASSQIVDPKLGGLADNGGATLTQALLAGSPALNMGNSTACSTTATGGRDGRGMPRDGACDIGAYEVVSAPGLNVAFETSGVRIGQVTTLIYTLVNPHDAPLTNVNFSHNLPANLKVANPAGVTNNCAGPGNFNATPGTTALSLSGATLAASQTCTVRVKVVSNVVGNYSTATGAIAAKETVAGGGSNSVSLNVVAQPSLSFSVSPATIVPGQPTTLSYAFANGTLGLSAVQMTHNLPAGLRVAATVNRAVCGGTLSATAGGSQITFSANTMAAGTCNPANLSVTITGDNAGNFITAPGLFNHASGIGTIGSPVTLKIVTPVLAINGIGSDNVFRLGASQPGVAKNVKLAIANVGAASTTLTVTNISVSGAAAISLGTVQMPVAIAGGSSTEITLTCNPAQIQVYTATLSLTTNDKNVPNTQDSFQVTCAGGYLVTEAQDDGTGATPGTLSYALKETYPAVIFALTSGTQVTLSMSGGLAIPAGTIIDGGCMNAGPVITLKGDGATSLTLGGNVHLSGLRLQGFSGQQLTITSGSNRFSCVRITGN